MHRLKRIALCFLLIVVAAILFSAGSVAAGENSRQGREILLDTYHRDRARLEANSFSLPLFLDSFEQDHKVLVDVYGIFDYPFSSIVGMLKVPANWCDIVSLHLNVKACTYRELSGAWMLTLYFGRKVYQAPEETRPVIYHYRTVSEQQGYLDIILSADEGPFGTKGHRMRFEALPLERGRTFVHVSYAYSDPVALRLAAKAYYATLGRGKAGFTVTGTDRHGKPVYIGGPRGSLERNAVRYYLAVESFMNALRHPPENRFAQRINGWYDLTSRYKMQLFELDKADYLAFKTKEYQNQQILQQSLGAGLR